MPQSPLRVGEPWQGRVDSSDLIQPWHGQSYCGTFLGCTLCSHSASVHPGPVSLSLIHALLITLPQALKSKTNLSIFRWLHWWEILCTHNIINIFLFSIWNVRECLFTVCSIVSIDIPVPAIVPWPFNNHTGRTESAECHYQVSKVKLSFQIKLSTVTDN